jgi:hypothetical protein
LEKEVIRVEQESDLLQEKLINATDQLEKLKKENDTLSSQLLVSQEDSQEANRLVKDLEQ